MGVTDDITCVVCCVVHFVHRSHMLSIADDQWYISATSLYWLRTHVDEVVYRSWPAWSRCTLKVGIFNMIKHVTIVRPGKFWYSMVPWKGPSTLNGLRVARISLRWMPDQGVHNLNGVTRYIILCTVLTAQASCRGCPQLLKQLGFSRFPRANLHWWVLTVEVNTCTY